jgi:hypothetical protein
MKIILINRDIWTKVHLACLTQIYLVAPPLRRPLASFARALGSGRERWRDRQQAKNYTQQSSSFHRDYIVFSGINSFAREHYDSFSWFFLVGLADLDVRRCFSAKRFLTGILGQDYIGQHTPPEPQRRAGCVFRRFK